MYIWHIISISLMCRILRCGSCGCTSRPSPPLSVSHSITPCPLSLFFAPSLYLYCCLNLYLTLSLGSLQMPELGHPSMSLLPTQDIIYFPFLFKSLIGSVKWTNTISECFKWYASTLLLQKEDILLWQLLQGNNLAGVNMSWGWFSGKWNCWSILNISVLLWLVSNSMMSSLITLHCFPPGAMSMVHIQPSD